MPVDASGNPYTVDPKTGQMLPGMPGTSQPYNPNSTPAVQPNAQVGATIPSGGSSLPTFSASMTADQAQTLANQYLQAAGLPPDTGGTWGNYWQQFGQSDPNYFMTRVLNGAATLGGNMAPFQSSESSTAPGGWGPGTSGFGPANGSGASSSSSGGFNFDPNTVASNPGYQFALQQGEDALQAGQAAQGKVLGTGAMKDLVNYGQGAAYAGEGQLYNQAQNTFQTNFGDLSSLANTGYNATNAAAGYSTGAAAAGAAGTVGVGNAVAGGVNAASNAAQNGYLYNQFNPNPNQSGSAYASNAVNNTQNSIYNRNGIQ